jgi:hypothetical protein
MLQRRAHESKVDGHHVCPCACTSFAPCITSACLHGCVSHSGTLALVWAALHGFMMVVCRLLLPVFPPQAGQLATQTFWGCMVTPSPW